MITRRRFLGSASATCAIAGLRPRALAAVSLGPEQSRGEVDVLHWVDPRIGTGGHGHCYPGAAVPFGMVQLSPDTYNEGWDWCSGYHISDTSIMGFSHTHLSGTGASDLLDFLVMPGITKNHEAVKLVPGTRENPDEGYRSRFSHDDEHTSPGYYSVLLKDYNIRAELTATERTGLHRYTFPASDQAYLILDLHHAQLVGGKSAVTSGELSRVSPDTLAGGHVTNAWGPGRHSYLTLQVSKTPSKIRFFKDGAEAPEGTLTGGDLKAVLHFNTHADEQILVKVGISGASAEGAARNLRAEIPSWDFDRTRRDAETKWRAQIGKIAIESDNTQQKRIFYTALYHMSLGPTLFDDVDGQYRGMDNEVHTLPPGTRNYTTFSLWDTFRAAHPAYTLLEPERVPQFMNTLIRMAEESPAGMPVWPLWGRETECMTGYHSAAVIAEACNKGFTGIDYATAFKQMQRARTDDTSGLQAFRSKGYIPADQEQESVSKSFEYCYDQWAIANVAKYLGNPAGATEAIALSRNYKNYWDPSVGYMRPKLADGSWAAPFEPIMMGHKKKWRDYTESNAWQTTFGVQHDPAGLIALLGGREAFVTKLDGLFSAPSTLPEDAPPDIAGMVGQYAHGNEPSHHIAYMYVYAGVPHKTQSRVRSLLDTMYADMPDGMQGNEDVGQMSAWYLLSALGFYPVDPVSGNYVLGSPLFPRARISMGSGRVLEISVKRSDPSHMYVQTFTLNGKRQDRVWFNHSEIAKGGTLLFEMGPEPEMSLGTGVSSLPPSLKLKA